MLEGTLSYSILEIAGHIVIGLLFITAIFIGFKYLSTTNQSKIKLGLMLLPIGVLPIALFLGLIYLNKAVDSPIIHFGLTGSLIIGVIAGLFLIGLSYWARTWVIAIVVALLTLPDYLLSLTSLKYEIQLITGWLVTVGGLAIYLWISSKLEKKVENS